MIRIGQGFDVHQLVEGRPLIIGGVQINFPKGLLGHSDADVLLHAISDALLGAAGLGDIGHFFPDTDASFKDANSLELLRIISKAVCHEGFIIGNIDCTILAEKPKMVPYLSEMKKNIAQVCQIETNQINIKATTMETMGFVGQHEGMGALSVALLEKKE